MNAAAPKEFGLGGDIPNTNVAAARGEDPPPWVDPVHTTGVELQHLGTWKPLSIESTWPLEQSV